MEGNKNLSKCWFCRKSVTRGCSWSRSFQPVEGWKAIRRDILVSGKGVKNRSDESYKVVDCPEYEEG